MPRREFLASVSNRELNTRKHLIQKPSRSDWYLMQIAYLILLTNVSKESIGKFDIKDFMLLFRPAKEAPKKRELTDQEHANLLLGMIGIKATVGEDNVLRARTPPNEMAG